MAAGPFERTGSLATRGDDVAFLATGPDNVTPHVRMLTDDGDVQVENGEAMDGTITIGTGFVAWPQTSSGYVMVVSTTIGGTPIIVADAPRPTAVAVAPNDDDIYWVDSDDGHVATFNARPDG